MSASNKKSHERIVHLGSKSPRNHNKPQHSPKFSYQQSEPLVDKNTSLMMPSLKPNQ